MHSIKIKVIKKYSDEAKGNDGEDASTTAVKISQWENCQHSGTVAPQLVVKHLTQIP